MHPDDYEKVCSSISEQISREGGHNLDYVEYRILRRDGSIRRVNDYGHFTHLPGYGDVYYVFVGDITEKHELMVEAARRAHIYEGMVRQFNENANESLTVFRTNITTGVIQDARGRDLYDTDYTGGSIAESARMRSENFLVPGDRERYEEIFALDNLVRRYYSGEGPATFVGYCRRQSGRQCFVKFSGSAVIDPVSGDVIAFGVENEYNTEKVTELLNQRVLAQQYDMVAYIVGDRYGVVIGDAKNIRLGNIALKDPELPEQTRGYLEKIDGSAKHLLGLINDILDMSRIESGRLVLRKEEFSFRKMIEQINTMVQSQCSDKGLQFDCRILGHVEDQYIGDDMKLKQVLINILSNAIKFTDTPGSVTFTVEQTARFEEYSTLRFVISDTGIGIDEHFLPRIFDAFTQEDSTRSNKYGSTGLGMAITKNLVEMMNGSISVESQKGVGTAFTVTVSLRNSEHLTVGDAGILPKDLHVLVIDDDPVACEHSRIVLEEIGISADTCLSGQEALRLMELRHAKHEPYHLLLVDWKMPEQDGVAVTRAIRDRYADETTVIILTAYNWDDIAEEALAAGVDSFMAKPLFASNVLREYEADRKRKNAASALTEHKAELTGRHILLAEDMFINAEIMKQVLSMRGMLTDHAENGCLAPEAFERSPEGWYDAILMDVRMSEMDGLTATAAIRALAREDAKTVPIIALTANAFDEDVQRSLQAGMNAHLSKPVEPDRLYETLEALIR